MGSWRQGEANPITGVATFDFDASSSFAWTGSISSFAYTLPAEAVVTSGSVNTATVSFTLPPGFWRVYCTVTGSNGKTKTGMRPVWVNHPQDYPTLNERYYVGITSDRQDRRGRDVTFEMRGQFGPNTIPLGGALFFRENPLFDGIAPTDGVHVRDYTGFCGDRPSVLNSGTLEEVTLSVDTKGPASMLGLIPMVSQAILEKASPARWTEVAPGLGTSDFIAWYVLNHHSSYTELFDFTRLPEVSPPRKKNWGLNGSNVWEYVEQTARVLGGNIGCTSAGSIRIRRDPNLEENDFRDDLDVWVGWNEGDLRDEVTLPRTFLGSVGQIRAYTLQYVGNEPQAFASIAPGFMQGQAPGRQEEDSFIVGAGDGQDRINRIAGHRYAQLNPDISEIQLPLLRNWDVTEPCQMIWHRLTLAASDKLVPTNPDAGEYDVRVLPLSVDRTWTQTDSGSWMKEVTLTVAPETFGQPGETFLIDQGGGSVYPPQTPPSVGQPEFNQYIRTLFAWNSSGRLGRNTNGTAWTAIDEGIEGEVKDVCIRHQSDYILSDATEGTLEAWVISVEDDTDIRVYTTANLFDSPPIWSLLTSETTDYPVNGSLRIVSSRSVDGLIGYAYGHEGGVYVRRSSNGGASWGSTAAVGEEGTPLDTHCEDLDQLGFFLDGNNFIVSGRNTTSLDGDGFDEIEIGDQRRNPYKAGNPIYACRSNKDQQSKFALAILSNSAVARLIACALKSN